MAKTRLDQLLVARELATSREKARALILSGNVLVNDTPVDKAGTLVAEDAAIRIRGGSRFVGRGGDKIDPAFTYFNIELSGRCMIDIGASTGGFTDCALQRGAEKVYAVDVGYNQLDHKLRQDPRVVVLEQTHAKDLEVSMFEPLPSLAVIDVSFISITKILQPVISVLAEGAEIVALVKPQFELEPELVEKGGVVRSEQAQQQAIEKVRIFAEHAGLSSLGEAFPSPLKGNKKGNQEYFLGFKNR